MRDEEVGGAVFNVIACLLNSRIQRVRVMIDGVRSEDVRDDSDVPQGTVLGPLLVLLYTSALQMILENTLVDYADESTL